MVVIQKKREERIEKQRVVMLNKPRKQRAGASKTAAAKPEPSGKKVNSNTLARYLVDVNEHSAKPLLDYSEAEVKTKIEKLYRKTLAPVDPPTRAKQDLDPQEKDRTDKSRHLKQRERIKTRLKELEKTKPVRSEIEVKEVGSPD